MGHPAAPKHKCGGMGTKSKLIMYTYEQRKRNVALAYNKDKQSRNYRFVIHLLVKINILIGGSGVLPIMALVVKSAETIRFLQTGWHINIEMLRSVHLLLFR